MPDLCLFDDIPQAFGIPGHLPQVFFDRILDKQTLRILREDTEKFSIKFALPVGSQFLSV